MSKQNLNLEDVLADKKIEEDLLEVPLTDRVFKIFFFLLSFLFAAILGKLFYLNIIDGRFYEVRASANMSEIKMQPAPRGIITDRFGKSLLRNEPATRVYLSPRDFPPGISERVDVLKKVSKALGISEDEIRRKIEEKDWGQSDKLLLSDVVSNSQLVAISSLNLPGVFVEPNFKRVAETPFMFSHVIGYTGLVTKEELFVNPALMIDDEIGKDGLEAYYDEYLRGKNGEAVFFRNAQGRIEDRKSIRESEPGNVLETFVDGGLQKFMYERLQEALVELGRNIGVAIAMNPKNGEILALSAIPSFDISQVHKFLNAPNQPFFNRAVSGLYNPGSTIKPLVATAALMEGVIDAKKQIFSAGYIEIPNPYIPSQPSRFLDWKPNGWVDVRSALAKSSNIYFYEVAGGFERQRGMGILKLKEWWQKFGLDKKTRIDLPSERSGFLPDPDWKLKETKQPWRLGDTYNVSIGQGDIIVTPIELLNYINSIANGGYLYAPRIMKTIRDNTGVILRETRPELMSDFSLAVSEALKDVRAGMRDVVLKPYGTAHSLNNLPINVAAKTGTAQVQNNVKVNAFFVGYAPFEDPQISLLILVENAREGSLNTIPVARDIFLWYYKNRLTK